MQSPDEILGDWPSDDVPQQRSSGSILQNNDRNNEQKEQPHKRRKLNNGVGRARQRKKTKPCQAKKGCDGDARYNFRTVSDSNPSGTHCTDCQLPGMVCVRSNLCKALPLGSCNKRSSCNVDNQTTAAYCDAHATDEMLDLTRVCKEPYCRQKATYKVKGSSANRRCDKHKRPGMEEIIEGKCRYPGCKKAGSFNHEGVAGRPFCGDHAELGMKQVAARKCTHPSGCQKNANYNYIRDGIKTGERCGQHRLPGMYSINNMCRHEGCRGIANYRWPGEKRCFYCYTHKEDRMKHVNRCIEPGCESNAHFALPGAKRRINCSAHASAEMRQISYPQCQCGRNAHYGIPGHKATACSMHKMIGMSQNPTKRCDIDDCKEVATFGISAPLHCEEHHTEGELNLVERKCIKCGLVMILGPQDVCRCCDEQFGKKFRLKKQRQVKACFDAADMKYVIYDAVVERGICNKKRPDFVFDAGTHFVVVEVDEDQHRHYPPECEILTMKSVTQSLGLPVRYIRYNPDTYESKEPIVGQRTRQKLLLRWIKTLTTSPPPKNVVLDATYLFYDGYSLATPKVLTFDVMSHS